MRFSKEVYYLKGLMQGIHEYQLFLFDFDGLLVNTEEIHYMAYKRMCARRGFDFDWDFPHYCSIAHYSGQGLQRQLFEYFPKLQEMEPNWSVLYEEKKQAFLELVREGAVQMMPGADKLLSLLEKTKIKRCVVTHSPLELIRTIKQQNPILHTIPAWITREDYAHPKPDPECYFKAIEKYATEEDRVIGFEDTPRGLNALMATRAQPVLIASMEYPEISQFIQQGAFHYQTLEHYLEVKEIN